MHVNKYTIGGVVIGALAGGTICGYTDRVKREVNAIERYFTIMKGQTIKLEGDYLESEETEYEPLPKMPPITVTNLEDLGVALSDIEETIIATFEEQEEAYAEEADPYAEGVTDEQFVVVDAEPQRVSVFGSEEEDTWDWEAETAQRGEDAPYVIHIEEFKTDEMNYHQHTLTYYEGDDILADEKDVPIYNYSDLVGDLKFGHGSEDRNVVYVRNDKYGAEYEILLHRGSYEVEVRGMQIEQEFETGDLKHSAYRFRHDD